MADNLGHIDVCAGVYVYRHMKDKCMCMHTYVYKQACR